MRNSDIPKAGLLPFYLKLYDDLLPERRAGFREFVNKVAGRLQAEGVEIETAPVCRVAAEFEAAVEQFENAGVDAIITLHLAYSPSLEAIESVCRTKLPLILLDTTMDADFGPGVAADRIMYNHGVHGVMDLASVLRRRERAFEIVAGHCDAPQTITRTAGLVRAAVAAKHFHNSSVLRVGSAFEGMGDFSVDESLLKKRFGIEVTQKDLSDLDDATLEVTDEEVAAEMESDRKNFECDIDDETHRRSVRVGLGLRNMLQQGGFSACSVNFQHFDRADRPADTMPFLEISKAMARGIGYAGEGDVLTAALVGALARAFGRTTFTEIFCPDWSGQSLFLSHMGEISPSVAGDRPRIIEKPFPFGKAADPAILTCQVKPGPAVFVNLVPGPHGSFSFIVAPVEVVSENDKIKPEMRNTVRAWIRPKMGLSPFLESYSRFGGTHHSALVLGGRAQDVAAFGKMCGLDVVCLPAHQITY